MIKKILKNYITKLIMYYKNLELSKIIQLAQNNDTNALNELIKRYQDLIFNTLNKQLDNTLDVSDLTQEVLFKMTKSIKNLKNPKCFKSWLHRIITNIFYDYLRKKNKITTYSIQMSNPIEENKNEEFNIEDKSNTPQENSLGIELQEKINNAIKDLPKDFKSIIVLREFAGLSYNKIAILTKTNVGTVKSRLSRAREKLQKELNEYLK